MKKTIYGLILAVFFGFYIFFGNEIGGVNAKALTVDEIQTVDDLKETKWELNEILNFNAEDFNENSNLGLRASTVNTYAIYTYGNNVLSLSNRSSNSQFISCSLSSNGYVTMYFKNAEGSIMSALVSVYDKTNNSEGWYGSFGTLPRELAFNSWENGEVSQVGNFIGWLKNNATLTYAPEPEPEEYKVNIDWPILEETMLLTQGETVTINFDELMQTYKNYEYIEIYSAQFRVTLPLYYKLTGFYLTKTPVYSEDLFFNSGTLTFSENIYLWAVSEAPPDYIFASFDYLDEGGENTVFDGYNLLIPFTDNKININWTYPIEEEMIVDITGATGFKISLSRALEANNNIIEFANTTPGSVQFTINKNSFLINKVAVNSYLNGKTLNNNTPIYELLETYEFNPQDDLKYYDVENRNINISVQQNQDKSAFLTIGQLSNYIYIDGGEDEKLDGAMITFFSLITGLINIKFGFISIGGILAILFGVALLTFIFKIWNGNNNG